MPRGRTSKSAGTRPASSPSPIVDTQVAAMVLGYGDSISYDQLVQRVTGDTLDKSHRFTDWTRRPLSEAQLAYAVSDVTHLRDVYLKLSADLDKRGRGDWMREEMKVLTSPDTYRLEPEHAWERLQDAGAQAEGARGPDRGRRLARARGAGARRPARPRAQGRRHRRHRDAGADHASSGSAALRSLPKGFERSRWGEAIVEAVKRGLARDPKTLPRIDRRNGRGQWPGHRRAAQGAAAHDRGKARRRRQGDRHCRRPRSHRRPTTKPTCRPSAAGGASCSARRRSRSSTAGWRSRSRRGAWSRCSGSEPTPAPSVDQLADAGAGARVNRRCRRHSMTAPAGQKAGTHTTGSPPCRAPSPNRSICAG